MGRKITTILDFFDQFFSSLHHRSLEFLDYLVNGFILLKFSVNQCHSDSVLLLHLLAQFNLYFLNFFMDYEDQV